MSEANVAQSWMVIPTRWTLRSVATVLYLVTWVGFVVYCLAAGATHGLGIAVLSRPLSRVYLPVFMLTVVAAALLAVLMVLGAVIDGWRGRVSWLRVLALAAGPIAVTGLLLAGLRLFLSPFFATGYPG